MKALPLWQPYASLIACGAKRIETRHWPAPTWLVGQRIAIYATKRRTELWRCQRLPFMKYLPEPEMLPLGAIVATAVLDRCAVMTEDAIAKLQEQNRTEYAFGNFEPGRYAWVLRGVRPVDPAVPFEWPVRGPAKFVDVPDDVVAAVREGSR